MNKKILTLLLSLALLGSSCSEFLSVNEVNPNSASKVPAKLLLPATLNNTAGMMNNPRNFEFVYLWHGLWCISSGYSQPSALVQYRLLNASYQGTFSNSYAIGQNLTEIEKATIDPKDMGYKAIAMIMKAYLLQNLVDLWGNVPYSEAFKATEGNLKPKYDDQKAIYEDLILKLDAAIKMIQALPVDATEIPASSDIIFGGNMTKWAKFANTIKLRMLVHQSGMTGRDTYIKAAIATTASVGYLGVGESALSNPGYLNSTGKMNTFYETFYKADGTSQSDGITYYNAGKDAVKFLLDNADPRVGRFFNPYSGSNYAGNTLGITEPAPLTAANTSKLGYVKDSKGHMIGTFDKSAPILTDFESLFVQAEAVERGFIAGSGKALYNSALTQSFVYLGLPAADATAFASSEKTNVNYDLAPNKVNLILMQKWISLNGIAPVEIWTDFRRSGIPNFLTFSADPNKANTTPPVRLLYPQREISVNNDNVVAVGTINAFTSKIFWQNR
ncbi:MAG: SusD/RagB family nutrient-binding outer membrane lipoprotein [Prolixibacteraceae bacterium]|nr:SusD/RagB family nutrient-binding outer membrane lipoprotein [Prolixibacteraceae bacterium]